MENGNIKLIEKYQQTNIINSHINNLTSFFLLDNQDMVLKHKKINSVYIFDYINLNEKLEIELEKDVSSVSKMKGNKILIGSFNKNYNLLIIQLKDKNTNYEILCEIKIKEIPALNLIELYNEMILFSNLEGEIYLLEKKSEKKYEKKKLLKQGEKDNFLLYELPNKEIVIYSFSHGSLDFYETNEFNLISSLKDFKLSNYHRENLSILNDKLLGFIIDDYVTIIDYIEKKNMSLIKINATCIYCLKDKSIVIGCIEMENDFIHYQFMQYQLTNENKLKFLSKKEDAQGNEVDFILQDKYGNILSSSNNNIKFFN